MGVEKMAGYPVNLQLDGRRCLVLGGGAVAERKVVGLLTAKAKVLVISPSLTPALQELASQGQISYHQSEYRPGTMDKPFLLICATDDAGVNDQAAQEGQSQGSLVNVVDNPGVCDFTVPAQFTRGDLQITISTAGKSPLLAKIIREELEERYGPEFGQLLAKIGGYREEGKRRSGTSGGRQRQWRERLDHEVLALLRAGKINEAEEKIRNGTSCIRTQP
jgi:precorrin-2 dehydrogenase/sirohydrochlorin ferrochelatase